MSRSAPHFVLLFVLLMCLRDNAGSDSGVGEPKIRCKEAERQALLRIKQDLVFVQHGSYYHGDINLDINVLLSSWGEKEEKRECCEWIGIRCSNNSGHVIELDLSLARLGGEASPQLGNLSSLQVLNLSDNWDLKIKSLNWVSRLSSLRVLDLSHTNTSLANDWVHLITNPQRFLTKLLLSGCNLPDTVTPASPSLVNSSEVLEVLDLSANPLPLSIFQWLFNYTRSLVHLDLSDCYFGGPFPNGFNSMAALKYLDLRFTGFKGIIPESFGNLISLEYLDLRDFSSYFSSWIPSKIIQEYDCPHLP